MTFVADPDAYFDALFTANDDPWNFRARWYESRKRALTLASLPHARYRSVYEPGCANGELSAALAERCDRLLSSDGSAAAVALARRRLAGSDHVEIVRGWVPQDWPDERFDLIVLSELAYYLDAEALDALALRAEQTLRPGGVIVACHWRAPIDGCAFDGDGVHRRLTERLTIPHLSAWLDRDFRLDVWCADGISVAERERLD